MTPRRGGWAGSIGLWCLLALLAVLSSTAAASDESWQKLQQEGVRLFDRKQFEQAAKVGARAVRDAEQTFGRRDARTADSLELQARACSWQGEHATGEQLYRRALAIREELGDQPSLANTLMLLVELYLANNQPQQAEALCRRALAIREEAFGRGAPIIADTLIILARVYAMEGHRQEAEQAYQRAVSLLESALGPRNPIVADTVVLLADLYVSDGKPNQAQPLYERALDIHREAAPRNDLRDADTMSKLAELAARKKDYPTAESLYRQALQMRQQLLGAHDPRVADMRRALSEVYAMMGEVEHAKEAVQQRQATHETLAASEHRAGSLATPSPAAPQAAVDEPDERRPAARVTHTAARDSNSMAQSFSSRAKVYAELGDYVEAEALYRQALAIYDKAPDVNPAELSGVLQDFAALLKKIGKAQEAASVEARVAALNLSKTP